MTTREMLHQLVDQLPDDLREASDPDGAPLDAATMASLERGLADAHERRVTPLDQYERERGL